MPDSGANLVLPKLKRHDPPDRAPFPLFHQADSYNHALRMVVLDTGMVITLVGKRSFRICGRGCYGCVVHVPLGVAFDAAASIAIIVRLTSRRATGQEMGGGGG